MTEPVAAFCKNGDMTAATGESLQRAAARLLNHHQRSVATGEDIKSTESDIRAAIRDLIVVSGLAENEDIALESDRTDMRTGQVIIEVKRRIGTQTQPDQKHVEQLDGYLEEARTKGRPERLGLLTDGKFWALRPSSETGQPFTTAKVRTFILRTEHDAGDWRIWLQQRIGAFAAASQLPDPASVGDAFATSIAAINETAELRRLYDRNASLATIKIKRGLWEDLLGAALGEAVSQTGDLDGLFVRHTYLAAAAGLALQASFGLDIEQLATHEPLSLIDGSAFTQRVGVNGVIESDFFGWIIEVKGGDAWIQSLAQRISDYDWTNVDYDIGSVLYQSVISADERKRLGEYYTPDWLAKKVVAAVVDEPLKQRVLDPACGSGTFLREAVRAFCDAAEKANMAASESLQLLQQRVIGMDVHPVAVHLARASWVLAARPLLQGSDTPIADITVPVYLGDSLQSRSDTDTLLGQSSVTVQTAPALNGDETAVLEFPKALVDDGDAFDSLLLAAAADIAYGIEAETTLQDAGIESGPDRDMLLTTLKRLKRLHDAGRNHIWAYYTRNLVRPVWLSSDAGRVDRIIGNPPWLVFNQTVSTIRTALQEQAKKTYNLWPKGRYVTHVDLAGLFYTRCLDLYLKFGGKAAMVMPHSALSAGQYEKWRTGNWKQTTADLSLEPWDLETVTPNNFFPVPACVVFASKAAGQRLASTVIQWHGPPDALTSTVVKVHPTTNTTSPYGNRSYQGATIVPRRLFFVHAETSATSLQPGHSDVRPLFSSQDKAPWKELDLPTLEGTVPDDYLFDIHRGDTVAPFVALNPLKAVLPFDKNIKNSAELPWPDPKTGDLNIANLHRSARTRWNRMMDLWETNKAPKTKLRLIDQLDYYGKLSKQIPPAKVRLVYSGSGRPTAAVLTNSRALIDYTLFWIKCRSVAEGYYLAAIINSDTLFDTVEPLMPKGQFGPRHLQKHLWKLDIAEYDPNNPIHKELARLGRRAAVEAARAMTSLQARLEQDKQTMTTTLARKELRQHFSGSKTGSRIETLVAQLNL